MQGDLKSASQDFQQALEYDGSIAIARVNLGYLFLIRGQYEAAANHFRGLLSDERIMLKSPRDILLAKLALGHALDEEGKKQDALRIYTALLTGLNLHDYTEVQDTQLRWAYTYNAIGKKLYLFNRDYYGLELFAFAMFGKSCTHLCSSTHEGTSSEATDTVAVLKEELSKNIVETEALARPEWSASFATPHGMLNGVASLLKQGCPCAVAKGKP